MNFEMEIDHSSFCEQFCCQKIGGIRPSRKYPFIILIHNRCSIYHDNLDASFDGMQSTVHYQVVNNDDYNNMVINHRNQNGVYHSILLFDRIGQRLAFLGEYEFRRIILKDKIKYFVLEKILNSLDNIKVYFVEKTEPTVCLSELGDRMDIINGIYHDEMIETDLPGKDFREGDYLDSNYNRINLNRIINTEQLNIDAQGIIRLIFQMEAESTPEEKRVGQHLFFLSELNTNIQAASRAERIELIKIEEPGFETAYLYTVNVGCALTNFLVLVKKEQPEVWVFDWGSGRGYKTDAEQFIKDCIEDIKTSFFCGNKFMINKLFISHADTDHYNRIDVSMIDNNTEVWVSGYNFIAGQFLNKLNQISRKTSNFKMPVCYNSSEKIKVLHPHQPIVYGVRTFSGTGFYLAGNKNDVSPILEVDIKNTKCVFPGDIGQQGWMWYKSYSGNKRIETDIYLHSHHGSVNGFITNIPNISDCEYDTVNATIDILSTRDNAYPGSIPSHDITSTPQYRNTKSTQLAPRELKYYKTDIIHKTVTPVYI